MTFWIDAQLDPEIAAWLGAWFKVVAKALKEIGLRDAEDEDLFDAARRFQAIVIVTKDSDFVDLVKRKGAPPQVLWLTCGNLSTVELQALLSRKFAAAKAELESGLPLVEISSD
jgi:predicted nuclease of predicted toxin-antitoxin system